MSNSVVIPSSPEDRKDVKNRISQISDSLTRIEAERDHINDILSDLQDQYELPKKHMRKVAKVYHKQNLTEMKDEFSDIEEIYTSVAQ